MKKEDVKSCSLRCLDLTSPAEALDALKRVGVDPYGIGAMLPKMSGLNLLLTGVPCKVANIIKQEMLAVGGDAAVCRGAVACSVPQTDVILIGTEKQIKRFAAKLNAQPFGLKEMAEAVAALIANRGRELHLLKTAQRDIVLGERPLIMGILNVTPDSFSDGGKYLAEDAAVERGIRMVEEGADIVDIGGESTRPGASPVSAKEERARVVPVVKRLAAEIGAPISVDTTKAAVAAEALEAGAEIVNDISAMRFDRRMSKVVADAEAAVVLMHMRGTPAGMQKGKIAYTSVVGDIIAFLRERIAFAVDRGIDMGRLMIDPGIGFGKTPADNLKLLKHLPEFRVLGLPIVTGISRKAFIGRITGEGEAADRDAGTAAAVAASVLYGSHVVRVHNVAMMRKAADVAQAILKA
jgi:dihydropteroate synthase